MEEKLKCFQRRLKKALESDGQETPKKVLEDFLYPNSNGRFKYHSNKKTVVCLCAQFNNVELLTLLMNSNLKSERLDLDLDHLDSCRWTPLHIAAEAGHEDMVGFLLNKGVNVNRRTNFNETPLHLASRGTSLGAGVNSTDRCGNTPLLFAASSDHVDFGLLYDLLEMNADVFYSNRKGETALHAIMRGTRCNPDHESNAIELLLSYGCRVDARTKLGRTPLHEAAIFEDEEAALLLIEAGCSVDIKDKSGSMPVSYAIRGNCHHLAELLCVVTWGVPRTNNPSMLERLLAMRTDLPKLSNFCRLAFFKHYGIEGLNHIDSLPLPATVKPFLAFKTLSL